MSSLASAPELERKDYESLITRYHAGDISETSWSLGENNTINLFYEYPDNFKRAPITLIESQSEKGFGFFVSKPLSMIRFAGTRRGRTVKAHYEAL